MKTIAVCFCGVKHSGKYACCPICRMEDEAHTEDRAVREEQEALEAWNELSYEQQLAMTSEVLASEASELFAHSPDCRCSMCDYPDPNPY